MKNHKLPGISFFHLGDDLMDYALDFGIQKGSNDAFSEQHPQTGFNKYFLAFCLILICLFTTTIGNAAVDEYELQVEFNFDIQAVLSGKQVIGYRLYKETEPACDAGPVEPQNIICTVNSEPGTYSFTLSESPLPPPEPDVPPTAIVSSSTSVGDAPLTVHFDGSSSTTMQPPIKSYVWNFGDGHGAAGAVTSHTFLIPGTYQTTLTVTDSSQRCAPWIYSRRRL